MFWTRIKEVKSAQLPVVDVDGAYLYRKQQSLIQTCVKVSSLNIPAPPLSSWEVINDSNVKAISPRLPVLTSGRHLLLFELIVLM